MQKGTAVVLASFIVLASISIFMFGMFNISSTGVWSLLLISIGGYSCLLGVGLLQASSNQVNFNRKYIIFFRPDKFSALLKEPTPFVKLLKNSALWIKILVTFFLIGRISEVFSEQFSYIIFTVGAFSFFCLCVFYEKLTTVQNLITTRFWPFLVIFIIAYLFLLLGGEHYGWIGGGIFITLLVAADRKYAGIKYPQLKKILDKILPVLSYFKCLLNSSKILRQQLHNEVNLYTTTSLLLTCLIIYYFKEIVVPTKILVALTDILQKFNVKVIDDNFITYFFIFIYCIMTSNDFMKVIKYIFKDTFDRLLASIFMMFSVACFVVTVVVFLIVLNQFIDSRFKVIIGLISGNIFYSRFFSLLLVIQIYTFKIDSPLGLYKFVHKEGLLKAN